MSQYEEVRAALVALHSPDAKNDAMVYQVFEDGEITLQKGGDLLWQRTLHCISPGRLSGVVMHPSHMPLQMRSTPHGYLFAKNKEGAEKARSLIFSLSA